MDAQVLAVQQWLNDTYGGASGWVSVAEDGVVGWATIYGLRRGLQVELGVSPLGSGFGPATTAAFTAKVGRIDAATTSERLLRLLSSALWCKGYSGVWANAAVTFTALAGAVTKVRADLGLGAGTPFVDVKLMASLLSMDSYTLLPSGSTKVRAVQQWLNATGSPHAGFPLVPCDGLASRQVSTAVLQVLQYELGVADADATGVFGPTTRAGLKSQAGVAGGSTDGSHRFVRLFQAALTLQGYKPPFTGGFDAKTASVTRSFQSFVQVPVTGKGDYPTWCAALVSCGDVDRPAAGFDTNQQLTPGEAVDLVALGYTHAGRYLVGAGKFLTAPELAGLKAAGLSLFPIFQRYNNAVEYMTEALGRQHAIEATERARTLGLPASSVIYVAVDFDPTGEVVTGPVADYFRALRTGLAKVTTTGFRLGVYGTRNVCRVLTDAGLVDAIFVLDASSGYSGNMGFPMPKNWQFDQFATISVTLPSSGRTISIDKDAVSRKARAVSLAAVVPPPVERDGSTSGTGFDACFEWTVRAEVAAERALVEASTASRPLTGYDEGIPDVIAHWVQTRATAYQSALWALFTPVTDGADADAAAARSAIETALTTLGAPVSTRDLPHFAATLQGYRRWGVPTDRAGTGPGDLGGWALDLLSLWGEFGSAPAGTDLATFCQTRIGSTTTTSSFGWSDVVADADAWLVAAQLRKKSGPSGLSQALRTLLAQASAQRVGAFYTARFGGTSANLVTAFTGLVSAVDRWAFPGLPISKAQFLQAAGVSVLPTQAQAGVLAGAYAEAMKAAAK